MSEAEDAVVLVAPITPKEGRAAEVERVLRDYVPRVHDEPGCLLYALHRDAGGGLVMIEKWASPADLATHRSSPGLKELGGRLADLLGGRSATLELTPLPEGPRGAL